MTTQQDRRAFVGSVVCGIPLLAAGSAAAFAQSFRTDAHSHPGTAPDPLLDHVVQQLALMLQSSQARAIPLRPDQARTAAAYLQVLAVHARTVQLDDRASRTVQAQIRARGREALLQERVDLDHVRRQLARRGLDVPARMAGTVDTLPIGERSAALDLVLNGGASTVFRHLASAVETSAARAGDSSRLRPIADDDGSCPYFQSQMISLVAIAAGFCSYLTGDYYFDTWCESIWTGAMMAELIYYSYC